MSGASGGRPQRHNEAVPSRHSIGTDAGSVPGGAHDRLRTGWNQRNDQYLRGQRWVPELGGKAWSLGCLPERRYPSRNRGITVGVHTILHRIFSPSKNQKGFHGTVPKFGCVALYQGPMRGSNSHDSTQNESLHASETADPDTWQDACNAAACDACRHRRACQCGIAREHVSLECTLGLKKEAAVQSVQTRKVGMFGVCDNGDVTVHAS